MSSAMSRRLAKVRLGQVGSPLSSRRFERAASEPLQTSAAGRVAHAADRRGRGAHHRAVVRLRHQRLQGRGLAGHVFVLAIPNAVSHLGWYVVASLTGAVASAIVLLLVKRPLDEPRKARLMATASVSAQ
jgi:hypothetical protein